MIYMDKPCKQNGLSGIIHLNGGIRMYEVKVKNMTETIDNILKHEEVSQRQMALRMGTTAQNVNQKMRRRRDIRVHTLVNMLDVLGYDLIARKREDDEEQ